MYTTQTPPCSHALRCDDCGRSVACSVDDILRYAEDGWPRCCGEVMSLDPGRPEWA